jgi:hypothetical protein
MIHFYTPFYCFITIASLLLLHYCCHCLTNCYYYLPLEVLTMETERFSVPEVLFRPSDLGLNLQQAGVVEALGLSIAALHEVII